MAVRIVYTLDGKAPDVVPEAKSWLFRDGTLKILSGLLHGSATKILVEIREDFVLSVEHLEFEDGAKKAPEEPKKDLEEPGKAPKKPKRALKGREAPKNTP